jgi:hypothetical protein
MDDNCPDGLDCPMYHDCHEDKEPGETCPLLDQQYDRDVPLDKIINDA